ncbi:hypothetical protein GGTG_14151 [Gaeumannomyces tritici R3-111a-1]|uniref:Uncharacterized protein n=1 Tax=Gaeumannomyces tritici (strain R3-111a-1) TaxID=644352 RepID=J3PKT4_GAET3|nr:hypothetical protein GGTG_14151 [Gaeumannomyces tritici R3-111a-1]EJT68270.1 hypothetical protein GGTG_14151 [Gaeumannomyces tritici R3-111a-1]
MPSTRSLRGVAEPGRTASSLLLAPYHPPIVAGQQWPYCWSPGLRILDHRHTLAFQHLLPNPFDVLGMDAAEILRIMAVPVLKHHRRAWRHYVNPPAGDTAQPPYTLVHLNQVKALFVPVQAPDPTKKRAKRKAGGGARARDGLDAFESMHDFFQGAPRTFFPELALAPAQAGILAPSGI